MEERQLLAVGIDIGTSTTQCVFSGMRLKNASPAFAVPRVTLEDKRVLYRAPTCLTPLSSPDTIDAPAVRALIERDYRDAGFTPSQVDVGAVIITGETARKKNAKAVTELLSDFAGDFVVATAGPDLEAVLAGKGAGAAQLSQEKRARVLNIDIGGGTSNICLFDGGEPLHMGSMDIGGRLIRFDEGGRVRYIAPGIKRLLQEIGIDAREGALLARDDKRSIARHMAEILEEACGFRPRSALHDFLVTEHPMAEGLGPDIVTFSGGVADCVYGGCGADHLFHDIGRELGEAIAKSRFFGHSRVLRPSETLNATVIGAGSYSMNVSGSTIAYERVDFPIKGLPVARVLLRDAKDIVGLAAAVHAARKAVGDPCAIGFEGLEGPGFEEIERVADALHQSLEGVTCPVLVMARDMAKALGQALARRRGVNLPLLCLDGVSLTYGDAVDIGEPLMNGRVLPVVVKTLAF